MTRLRSILFRSVISAVLLLLTGFAIGKMLAPRPMPQISDLPRLVSTVEVVPIQQHHAGIDFAIDGEVIPFRRLDLISEIQGRVIYKSEQCRLGRTVQKDDVLMRIDPVDYQIAVEQAETALKQAKVNIDENNVQKTNTEKELFLNKEHVELCQRDYDRNRQLAEKNTITPADLDAVRATLLSAQENVQRLENQIRVIDMQTERLEVAYKKEELALQTAQLNLTRTEIRAPMTGVITADSFEVNSFIQKGADIGKILDTSQLEIQCSMYMKQIQWIWRQTAGSTGYVFAPTPVTILYDMEGEHWVWEGELTTLDGGMMNAQTRMVPCRVKVKNPYSGSNIKAEAQGVVNQPMLFAGMYVTIVVHSKPAIPLYRIPERALLPGNKIWTVEEGKLCQHSIRIATTTPEGVLFYADSEAIKPNDLVVVSPLASPAEGSKVQTVQQIAALRSER